MKKILSVCLVCLALVSCGSNTKEGTVADSASEEVAIQDVVEVIYFHGKQRCATCMAIEKNAKEAVENDLAEAASKGNVIFKTIDISQKENEALAEKYEVTWSSLFVVKHKGGVETVENLTEFAFGNARKSPAAFKAGVVKVVNDMLK